MDGGGGGRERNASGAHDAPASSHTGPPEASRSAHARMPDSVMVITRGAARTARAEKSFRFIKCFGASLDNSTCDEFPRLPKHAAAAGGLFRKRLAVPAQCGRRHGDGGGADAPQGGAHSGPARGVFPRAVPPARAGARARGGGTRGARRRGRGRGIRRCSRAGATRGPGARARGGRWGGSPGGRRGAPVESGARRVPEAHGRDRRQGTRACRPEPRTEPSVKPNVPKKGALFFFCQNAANQPRSSSSPHAPPAP